MKNLGRVFKTKEDYLVQLTLTELKCKVDQDCFVQLQWSRGKQKDLSQRYKILKANPVVHVDFHEGQYQKISTFYAGKDGKFQPKTCEFAIL